MAVLPNPYDVALRYTDKHTGRDAEWVSRQYAYSAIEAVTQAHIAAINETPSQTDSIKVISVGPAREQVEAAARAALITWQAPNG